MTNKTRLTHLTKRAINELIAFTQWNKTLQGMATSSYGYTEAYRERYACSCSLDTIYNITVDLGLCNHSDQASEFYHNAYNEYLKGVK